jgi:hypothetical protein
VLGLSDASRRRRIHFGRSAGIPPLLGQWKTDYILEIQKDLVARMHLLQLKYSLFGSGL